MVKNSCHEMQNSPWDEKEDGKTVPYGSKQPGTGNWTTFSKRSGQRRSGKIVREKCGNNHQKPDPRQRSFTPEEEDLVIQLHAAIGSRWPIIAQQLPGKTDNDVKTLWNSKLRKKLSSMGIDPVTHKPFSQILADYGNIGAFPKARARFSSLSKDLKSAIVFNKTEHPQNSPQIFSPNRFSAAAAAPPPSPPIDLYSQLQAVSFITEASKYARNENHPSRDLAKECVSFSSSANQENSSGFSWGDFLLEDPFSCQEADGPPENEAPILGSGEFAGAKGSKCGAVGDHKNGGRFEGSSSSSSSNGSSFVDAMLESQDAMFSQLSCFCEEPFYY